MPPDDAGDDGFVVDILRIGIDGGEFMRRFGQVERMDAARGASRTGKARRAKSLAGLSSKVPSAATTRAVTRASLARQ